MTSAPVRIRATYSQELLVSIDALGDDDERARILGRLVADLRERIDQTSRLAFMDGADHQAILEAAHAELDRDTYLRLIRYQTARYKDSTLIAATVRTLVRLSGGSPHALLKHLPRLRDATVQGYGTLTYTRTADREAFFHLRGYPPAYMTDANTGLFVGTYLGALDIVGAMGSVDVIREDRAAGDAEHAVRWA